jgi:hypothetical protein
MVKIRRTRPATEAAPVKKAPATAASFLANHERQSHGSLRRSPGFHRWHGIPARRSHRAASPESGCSSHAQPSLQPQTCRRFRDRSRTGNAAIHLFTVLRDITGQARTGGNVRRVTDSRVLSFIPEWMTSHHLTTFLPVPSAATMKQCVERSKRRTGSIAAVRTAATAGITTGTRTTTPNLSVP